MENIQYHKTKEAIASEAALVAKAQKDMQHFAPLYNQYFGQIFRFVFARVGDKQTTADVVQQVFFKAMKGLAGYKSGSVPFSAWLYRIAVNEIADFFTDASRNRLVQASVQQLHDMELGISLTTASDTEQNIELIQRVLAQLPSDDLLLIELRFFEAKSFREIGDILNITENNAKVRLYRLLDSVKTQIVSLQ